ncbi:MAG: aromatic ring-hydroxylating dioxygenase subunit alpha [Novosphingobium sp.]|nr:aromatic ring-hydroxylating dioxygenase subunit alpha [Novosphingobium sp.]
MNDMTSERIRDKVPYAITDPDRIPAKRYYDREFYDLELKNLWPRAWQMACRLEDIPEEGDYSVYRNVGKSVIVIRTGPDEIKAYDNVCRHRGVELVNNRGKAKGGFICPFHGWRWDTQGNNTFVYAKEAFAKDQMCEADLKLTELRVEVWGGCVFINHDRDAPGFRENLGVFGENMDLFKVEQLRAEWWLAATIPCNWKLAMEAFMEGYHVATTHPQLLQPGVTNRPGSARWAKIPEDFVTSSYWQTMGPDMPEEVDAKDLIDTVVMLMGRLNEGMGGMTSREEVEVVRSLRDTIELPRNTQQALVELRRQINDAIVKWYRDNGMDVADINELDRQHRATSVNFCFPHFFLLPVHGAASSYRIRPLGPEETLFELWSLKRYPKGQEPPIPPIPTPMPHDDPSWPPIPKQDYSNLPRQQRGLHAQGFEFMRLSEQMEGLISNFHRTLDKYLAREDSEKLARALRLVSGPIDVPCYDI